MAINGSGPAQIQEIFAARGVHIQLCEAMFLNALLCRERLRTREEIIDSMYSNREDGGPLTVDKMIDVLAYRCRKHIAKSGVPWFLETDFGRGYRLRYIHD